MKNIVVLGLVLTQLGLLWILAQAHWAGKRAEAEYDEDLRFWLVDCKKSVDQIPRDLLEMYVDNMCPAAEQRIKKHASSTAAYVSAACVRLQFMFDAAADAFVQMQQWLGWLRSQPVFWLAAHALVALFFVWMLRRPPAPPVPLAPLAVTATAPLALPLPTITKRRVRFADRMDFVRPLQISYKANPRRDLDRERVNGGPL